MKWFALVAAVIAAVTYGWSAAMPSRNAHRFRLTVEVNTTYGPRSGSSVVEVEREDVRWIPVPGSRYMFRVRGEAVFVDLGGGRNLVAVLTHGDNAQDVSRINSFWSRRTAAIGTMRTSGPAGVNYAAPSSSGRR